MGHSQYDDASHERAAWNAGKKVGTKRPLTGLTSDDERGDDNVTLRCISPFACAFPDPGSDFRQGDRCAKHASSRSGLSPHFV